MPSSTETIPINPLLTSMSVAYRNAKEGAVADFCFPKVMTGGKTTGTYYTYDKGNAFQTPNFKRARRTEAAIIDWHASKDTFSTEEYAGRDGWDDKEKEEALSPMNLPVDTMEIVEDLLLLAYERRVHAIVTDGSIITQTVALSGTDQWSDNSSDPYSDIITGIKTIQAATGLKAVKMVVGGEVWYDGLLNHPDIVDRVKHTTKLAGDANITPSLVGQIFGLDLRVSDFLYNSANEGQTVVLAWSWGKKVLIFFSPRSPSVKKAALGYTLTRKDLEVRKYYERAKRTTFVEVSHDTDEKTVDATCGYLITAAVA